MVRALRAGGLRTVKDACPYNITANPRIARGIFLKNKKHRRGGASLFYVQRDQ